MSLPVIYIILLVVLAVLGFAFYASYYIGSNVYIKTICKATTNKKELALTFDDGPNSKYTSPILDTLSKHNIKAAFFCIGTNIAGNEAILQRLKTEGHIIANHSFVHTGTYDFLSASKIEMDLKKTEELIYSITGLKTRWFRPPFGISNPMIAKAVKRLQYVTIGWNIRSYDTVIHNEQKLLNRITQRIKPGAIILMHDRLAQSANVLPKIIDYAHTNGYVFVRPDILLNLNAYEK